MLSSLSSLFSHVISSLSSLFFMEDILFLMEDILFSMFLIIFKCWYLEGHDIKCRSRHLWRWSNADVMTWMLLTIKLSNVFKWLSNVLPDHLLADDVLYCFSLISLLNSQISLMISHYLLCYPPIYSHCPPILFMLSSLISLFLIDLPVLPMLSSLMILISSHVSHYLPCYPPGFPPWYPYFLLVNHVSHVILHYDPDDDDRD